MELPFLALARGGVAFNSALRPSPDLEQHLVTAALRIYYARGEQLLCRSVPAQFVPSAIGPVNGALTTLVTTVGERAREEYARALASGSGWVYLGAADGEEHVVVRLPDERTPDGQAPDGRASGADNASAHEPGVDEFGVDAPTEWIDLRFLAHRLGDVDSRVAVTALALLRWHEEMRHCPDCGAPAAVTQGGWGITCTADATLHFPHIAPAVIMAITDDQERILLGHGVRMPPGMFTTIAGFIDAGESAENAVRREVMEETGVTVSTVAYFGSQPWPFPGSLMLGFTGKAESIEIDLLDHELAEARWFSRQEWRAAIADGHVRGPMPASIAFSLITDWLERER